MNINKNNYEAYFLDYHEGNLSPQEVADLFLFLSEHPELKKELDDFENVTLEDFPSTVFENKESLKKNITQDNREDYFIRAIEGNLDANESILLQTFLTEHPEFLEEFKLFEKIKLQPDPAVVFENKQELKQLTENDQLLISSIEGLLSKKEQTQFEKKLAQNAELRKEFVLYQQTRSTTDSSIVFADKQKLKRKERKVVPLFYYVSAAAAAVAIIIGLFFMFRTTTDFNNPVVQHKNTTPVQTPATATLQAEQPSSATVYIANVATATKKKRNKKPTNKQQLLPIPTADILINTTARQDETSVAATTPGSDLTNTKSQTLIDSSIIEPKQNTAPVIAKIEKKTERSKAPEFFSIGDLFASKLKEKLIGKDDLADQEKNKPAKLNGWDIACVFAKGLTNLTGKKIAIKPQFNKEGEITAYAFSAGNLEFSKVK